MRGNLVHGGPWILRNTRGLYCIFHDYHQSLLEVQNMYGWVFIVVEMLSILSNMMYCCFYLLKSILILTPQVQVILGIEYYLRI
jgi:hypothetical protein